MNDTLYARWLSGELTEQEIADLKASGEWEDLQTLINEMDKLTLPNYDKDAAFQRLKSTQTKSKPVQETKVRKLNVRPLLAVAAGLLLVLAIGFLVRNNANKNEFIVIEAKAKETKTHIFEDQSMVTLNDGSQCTYQPQKWNENRGIELTGEGFFEVKKGTPFKIITKHGTVEVLGTSFNVRAWGDRLSVECYTGKVRVSAYGKSITLIEQQSVRINRDSMKTDAIEGKNPDWSTGTSYFREESVVHVFEELERQYNVIITPTNLRGTYTGKVNHDSLEDALRQICRPKGFTYKIDGNEIFIEKRKNE